MNDLIERQAAIDLFPNDALEWDTNCGYIAPHFARRMIEELPFAQPEIVRCKDCKHMVEHKGYGYLGESAYTCEGNMDGWILPDSYCSNAERKEK